MILLFVYKLFVYEFKYFYESFTEHFGIVSKMLSL